MYLPRHQSDGSTLLIAPWSLGSTFLFFMSSPNMRLDKVGYQGTDLRYEWSPNCTCTTAEVPSQYARPPMEGLNQTLEIERVEATRERVVMRMPVTLHHRQPWGFLHGGASLASLPLIERAKAAASRISTDNLDDLRIEPASDLRAVCRQTQQLTRSAPSQACVSASERTLLVHRSVDHLAWHTSRSDGPGAALHTP